MWGELRSDVTLPLWAVVLLAVFAALSVTQSLLLPSFRWALRRRANKAIAELNTRLQLHIQPFKLTKRSVLVDRLLFDPEVLAAVEKHAADTNITREQAMAIAGRYVREIVPSFSAYTYFKVGTRLARRISQAFYRVRIGFANDEALKSVPPDASVVFVINHRSNMDYVLVTYVAASSSALSYAVGEWAQVWGLRGLIRSMGAYFIRRNSRDPLYRKVLARYVDMATKAGVVQAIFPEGGLTRDGTLRPPKLGLLTYIIAGFDPKASRDVVFIPVGVNYDRVLEDRVLTGATSIPPGETPRFAFNPLVFGGFVVRNLWLLIRGHWHRYGYASVNFGTPLSLSDYLQRRSLDFRTLTAEARQAEIDRLGNTLMTAVGRVIPALPVSIVASVLLENKGEPQTLFELKGRAFALMSALEKAGANIHIPRSDRDYAIETGLRMLKMRHLMLVEGDSYRAAPGETALLEYYANSIGHLGTPTAPVPVKTPAAATAAVAAAPV